MKIAAILAEGFEETEFIAVTDLLRRASLDVLVVSSTGNLTVSGAHDFKIVADSLWDDVEFEDVDCIFLPGGMPGVTNLQSNKKVVETVQRFAEQDKFICAICAAPLVLDDAMVRFDDTRLALALDILGEMAENKQVILFTCQSREKKLQGEL